MGGVTAARARALPDDPRAIALRRAIRDAAPAHRVKAGASQIGLWRAHRFAAVSAPARRHIPSPRWKEVTEPRPGRVTHHIGLRSPSEVDAEAVEAAGRRAPSRSRWMM